MPVMWPFAAPAPGARAPESLVSSRPAGPPEQAPEQAPEQGQADSDEAIRIVSGRSTYEVFPRRRILVRNGTVRYGDTTLSAALIELYPAETGQGGTGRAEGGVSLLDPVGKLSADSLDFDYGTRSGSVKNAVVRAQGLVLQIASADVRPTRWELRGVRAAGSGGRGAISAEAREVVVYPGQRLVAYGARLVVEGVRTFGFHRYRLALDQRIGGDQYPVPTFDGRRGVGLRYRPTVLLDRDTAFSANYAVSGTAYPTYAFALSRSFAGAGETSALVTPKSDLDRRWDFGYFDDVSVGSPEIERSRLDKPRSVAAVGFAYNVQAFDRLGAEVFAKPIELAYERSQRLPFGVSSISQVRFEEIREVGEATHRRFQLLTSVELPSRRLAPGLSTLVRLDGQSEPGDRADYSWLHAETGLAFRPNPTFRLAAAFVASKQWGDPLYDADRLYSMKGFDLRQDLTVGPRALSTILKFDSGRRAYYDCEVRFTQAVGPFEAFVQFRSFPAGTAFGLELRLDSGLQELFRRNPRRPGSGR